MTDHQDPGVDRATVQTIGQSGTIEARILAPTARSAFLAAAISMLDAMVPGRKSVPPPSSVPISLDAGGWEGLLISWLNEIRIIIERERFIPSAMTILSLDCTHLDATLHGDTDLEVVVMVLTPHQLVAEETDTGFRARVRFDI